MPYEKGSYLAAPYILLCPWFRNVLSSVHEEHYLPCSPIVLNLRFGAIYCSIVRFQNIVPFLAFHFLLSVPPYSAYSPIYSPDTSVPPIANLNPLSPLLTLNRRSILGPRSIANFFLPVSYIWARTKSCNKLASLFLRSFA
jgi:hypothetical protein